MTAANLSIILLLALTALSQARLTKNLYEEKSKFLRTSKDTFCTSPVSKEKVVFPDSLAGRAKINFEMYSGYVNVTSAPDYLFYWFFGAQKNPSTAPLIIWTNGGPGCTAMEGATTEHGPLTLFDIKESCSNGGASSKCDYTLQLSTNTYAWNVNANVLYVDQPRNVGYSFGYGAASQSSVEAASDMVVFYKNWLNLFPEFKGRKVIIAGESYGGHYIPAWSNAMIDYNAKVATSEQIPLSAVVIGNGCVNDTVQGTDSFIEFQHETNLIPTSSHPRTSATAYSEMVSNLGYTPNYYDYRIQSVTCSACYSYNYTAWSLWFLKSEVLSSLHICGDAGVDAFAGSAGGCISMGSFDSRDNFDYSGALAKTLEKGIPVTVYYGKTDTACQYVGGQRMTEQISWKGQKEYNNAPYNSWIIGGVEAGQIKSSGGLTYIGVEDAGHMVPMDQPAASAAIIQNVLAQL